MTQSNPTETPSEPQATAAPETPTPAAEATAETAAPEAAPETPKVAGSKWYIVHAHSGFEKKVAAAIKEQAVQKNLVDKIEDVVVPVEEVVEVRRGKKVPAERKFFPGYVMVKMLLTDATWHMVKNTPKVTGFLGGGGKGKPVPITDKEADRIFAQVQEGIEHPKASVTFEIGENVKITDGPFDSFVGVVEAVDEDKQRVKVSVSIFGRPTPVDLDYTQVEKV